MEDPLVQVFSDRLLAASLALILGILGGVPLLLGTTPVASAAAASPAASAAPLLGTGPLAAGVYSMTPFRPPNIALCMELPQPGCSETPEDDDLRLTFTVPEGWTGLDGWILTPTDTGFEAPGGAAFIPMRGGWLFSDPCAGAEVPDVPVGPTVDDFVGALVDHPLLDVTTPVDVTIGGHPGQYLELRTPSDTAACPDFYAWQPGIYAQGPDDLWHLWVLDVDGLRVVLRADTYPGTSPEIQGQLEAIVGSVVVDHAPAPPAGSSRPAIGSVADDGARIVQVDTIDARTRDLTIESPSVGTVKVRLLLPATFDSRPDARWPVLFLLHGHNGGFSDWTGQTDVAALTAATDLLVVMPDAASGWYSDAWNGGAGGPPAWETFHTTELVQLLERDWQAGDRRVVAGLSMGGLGAIDYAARHPGLFLAAASYSGVLDPRASDTNPGASQTWGDPIAQPDVWVAHDPMSLAPALEGIALYISYGSGGAGPLDMGPVDPDDLEREIGVENEAFVARLEELGIPATVDAYGPGSHTWPYWERALRASLPTLLEALGEPTAPPSPIAMPATGALEAGTYFIENPYRSCERGCSMYRGVTVSLPDGWAVTDGRVSKHLGEPGEVAFRIWTVDGVYADACHWQNSTLRPLDHVGYQQDARGVVVIVGGDANTLVTQTGRVASVPTPLSQDGRYLMRVELVVPADLDLATCDGGQLRSWTGVGGDVNAHHAPGQVDVVYMVDVDRHPLVIDASYRPATTTEDRAELEAILASMLWGYG